MIRRFRDEVMEPTSEGARMVDYYYHTTELLKILVLDRPDLGARAVGMVELLQPSLHDVIDGDGSLPITQAQMDSVAAFFADLSAAGSDSLQHLIADEFTRLGPLDGYVGLPVGDVLKTVLGDPIGTTIEDKTPTTPTDFVLEQNFPNPFQAITQVRYALSRPTAVSLTIYNIQGQKIRTLMAGTQREGVQSVMWNGRDDAGVAVPSGVCFVRLITPARQQTKKMIVTR